MFRAERCWRRRRTGNLAPGRPRGRRLRPSFWHRMDSVTTRPKAQRAQEYRSADPQRGCPQAPGQGYAQPRDGGVRALGSLHATGTGSRTVLGAAPHPPPPRMLPQFTSAAQDGPQGVRTSLAGARVLGASLPRGFPSCSPSPRGPGPAQCGAPGSLNRCHPGPAARAGDGGWRPGSLIRSRRGWVLLGPLASLWGGPSPAPTAPVALQKPPHLGAPTASSLEARLHSAFYFFKRFYLFIRERVRESRREVR